MFTIPAAVREMVSFESFSFFVSPIRTSENSPEWTTHTFPRQILIAKRQMWVFPILVPKGYIFPYRNPEKGIRKRFSSQISGTSRTKKKMHPNTTQKKGEEEPWPSSSFPHGIFFWGGKEKYKFENERLVKKKGRPDLCPVTLLPDFFSSLLKMKKKNADFFSLWETQGCPIVYLSSSLLWGLFPFFFFSFCGRFPEIISGGGESAVSQESKSQNNSRPPFILEFWIAQRQG